MTLDLERIRAAVLSANPAELRRWVEALRRLCIPCQWSPPRHCGKCPCCRQPEPVPFDRTLREPLRLTQDATQDAAQDRLSTVEGPRPEFIEGPPVKQYHFYRIWRAEKFYLFCRAVGTPNRSNAALFTEADREEWAQGEGLQREEVEL